MWLLSGYAGWGSHDFSEVVGHPERSDILDAFIPRWMDLKEQLRAGGGLWSAITSNGAPGILDLSNGALNPSFLVFLALDDPWLGFYAGLLVKLVVASLGAFCLARLFVGVWAAALCGLIYAYCGFNSAWFYWPQVSTSSIAPWFLWSIFAWVLSRGEKYYFAIFISSVLLIVSGFPAVSAYFFYVFSFLVVFLVFSGRIGLGGAATLVLIVVSAFLACALPIISLSATLSHADLGYRSGGTPYLFPRDIQYLWDPFFRGGPRVERTVFIGWIALTLSSLGVVFTFFVKSMRGLAWFASFWALVFVASFSAVYGVIPASLMGVMPGIGNSLWSRMAIVMALALSVLSAVGAECLFRMFRAGFVSRYVFAIFFLLICGYQVSDQLRLFRTFNAPSSAVDFFPKTKSLSYVSENTGVTHSALADDGFMISGTLGAYGIAEWFAHGLKGAEEKAALGRLVKDPFVSPTAARFSYDAISHDADYAAKLGVKFVLTKRQQGSQVIGVELSDNYPSPSLNKSKLIQEIYLSDSVRLRSIGIVFGTYNKLLSKGRVVVSLRNESGYMVSSEILASEIRDNALAFFSFDDAPISPGNYKLEVSQLDFSAGETLAVWVVKGAGDRAGYLFLDGKKTSDAIAYKLYKPSDACCMAGWRLHQLEPGISVYENLMLAGDSYYVASLVASEPVRWAGVELTSYSGDSYSVKYSGEGPGFVVVPKRWFPGWRAYFNGVEIGVDKYLGVLLAARVSGPGEVVFLYRPPYVIFGLLTTCLGILLFVFSVVIGRRFKSKLVVT